MESPAQHVAAREDMTLPPMCDDFSASISMKGYNVQLCFEHINYALIEGSRYSKFSENLGQGKVR